jgi:hypothetical protein
VTKKAKREMDVKAFVKITYSKKETRMAKTSFKIAER